MYRVYFAHKGEARARERRLGELLRGSPSFFLPLSLTLYILNISENQFLLAAVAASAASGRACRIGKYRSAA